MSSELYLPIAALVCVVLLGGTAVFILLQRRRRRRAWRAIGEELGLRPEPKEPIIQGRYRDLLVTAGIMSVEGGPHGGSQPATTLVRASLPGSSSFALIISRESVLSKIGKMAGAEDLELNDRSFDERFVVKTNSAALAKELLSPTIRRALLKLDSEHLRGVIRIMNNSIFWESREIVLEPLKIRAVLETAVDIAERLAALEEKAFPISGIHER